MKAEYLKDPTLVEEEVEEAQPAPNTGVEDMRSVIEKYKERHPEIEISIAESSKIKV